MFEEVLLAGPRERSIVLQTHRGTAIKNEIALHPVPDHAVAKFNRLREQHPNWIVRKPPTGVYNCIGHVWASRRTAVYERFDEIVLLIRQDDGYRAVDWNRETPVPGDVACYWEQLNPYRGCVHVGQVIGVRPQGTLPPTIFVLSKWDDVSGEVLHEAADFPKSFGNVRIEYWTDRS